jgi:uncharacterized protein with HEPN domain
LLASGFAQYAGSWQIRRAVERGIEITSEASRHLPDELKAQYPQIYWKEIAAIGNLLRHEYLPELKAVVLDIKRQADTGA